MPNSTTKSVYTRLWAIALPSSLSRPVSNQGGSSFAMELSPALNATNVVCSCADGPRCSDQITREILDCCRDRYHEQLGRTTRSTSNGMFARLRWNPHAMSHFPQKNPLMNHGPLVLVSITSSIFRTLARNNISDWLAIFSTESLAISSITQLKRITCLFKATAPIVPHAP